MFCAVFIHTYLTQLTNDIGGKYLNLQFTTIRSGKWFGGLINLSQGERILSRCIFLFHKMKLKPYVPVFFFIFSLIFYYTFQCLSMNNEFFKKKWSLIGIFSRIWKFKANNKVKRVMWKKKLKNIHRINGYFILED